MDFKGPSLIDIYRILDIIQEFHKKNQSVYIHCKSGKGRSAIVVACYFIEVSINILSDNSILNCFPFVILF